MEVSHEAQEVQVHQAPEDTARRGARSQSLKAAKKVLVELAYI
jgi:hypothetical protein